ncbi:MAG: hypothetical protein JNK05_22565 [Myxococcales bacterium]|nr:hypothetical protein [Myxococcales bacterium]
MASLLARCGPTRAPDDSGARPDRPNTPCSTANALPTGDETPLRCERGRFCNEWPLPFSRGVAALEMVADDAAWAVGARGALARYLGGRWSVVDVDTDVDLRGVIATGPDNVWAWGQPTNSTRPGVLLRWDGRRWTRDAHADTRPIHGLFGHDGAHMLSVSGAPIELRRWRAGRWTSIASPLDANETVVAACVYDADEIVIAASRTDASARTRFIRFHNNAWSVEHTLNDPAKRFIGMLCPDRSHFVVVAPEVRRLPDGSVLPGYVARVEGERVSSLDGLPTMSITRVVGSSDGRWFVVASNTADAPTSTVFEYRGGAFVEHSTLPTNAGFDFSPTSGTGMAFRSDRFAVMPWRCPGWASNDTADIGPRGLVGPPGAAPRLAFGKGLLARRADGRWTPRATNTTSVFVGAWMPRDGEAWLVRGNELSRFDGTTVTPTLTAPARPFVTVVGASENDGWAVNELFTDSKHWDGIRWGPPSVAIPESLMVDGAPVLSRSLLVSTAYSPQPNELWVGTYNQVLVHFDGARWSAERVIGSAPNAGANALVRGRDRALWYLVGGRVYRRSEGAAEFSPTDGAEHSIKSIAVVGDAVFALFDGVVRRWSDRVQRFEDFADVGTPSHRTSVRSLYGTSDALWVATDDPQEIRRYGL